ncbi:MAG: PfkB family carbohydrate kinase [Treponema sp.]|jgi:fructose-1-phosphate kinase PfkB-like protein|nr:PfkB family carbohydrate kinase [Treponema sp.]
MYLTISMNPTLQKIVCFSSITKDAVNRSRRHRFDVAGKGLNVCRVLSQLGKDAVHLTILGGETRPLFLEMSRREGIALQWVDSGIPIRFCYTLIDEGDGTVTELIENTQSVAAGTEERLREAYEDMLPKCGVVVIAGTKAGGLSGGLVPFMVRRAKETGRRVALDLWGGDLLKSLPYGPDVIKPNLTEFAATFFPEEAGTPGREQVRELCIRLCREYRCAVVLTRGTGAVWYAEGETFAEYPFVPAAEAVNTTGSGDAFTAGLVAALGEGQGLREAVAGGVRCGGLNAGFLQVGTIKA